MADARPDKGPPPPLDPVVEHGPPPPALDPVVEHGPTPPPAFGLLVLAALVIICAGLKTVSSIVAPTFLVLTLVITVQPVGGLLQRRGLPRPLASIVVLLSVYALLVAVLGSAVWSISRLITALPAYSSRFTDLFNQSLAQLARFGIDTSTLRRAVRSFDLSSFAGVAQSALSTVTSGLSLLVLLLVMVFFLTFDGAGFEGRVGMIRGHRPLVADALLDFAQSVRKYWSVTTVFGLIVAAIDLIALLIIGVPMALTWAVLAFVTNYIPNIGFVLGLIPPVLIALLEGGVGPALAVIICYVAVNVVVQTLIQPRFTGDAVGITPTVAFLSLIFWAFVMGPLGALLAIPATLLVKALLVDHSPNAGWLAALIDSSPAKREAVLRLGRRRSRVV